MALGSILVDRARTVRKAAQPTKVDGTTQHVAVTGDWFKCRLWIRETRESASPGDGPRRTVQRPTLIYRDRDNSIALKRTDKVQVDSAQFGETKWEVVADPEAWRKKRSIVGFQVTLQRVREDKDPA